GRRGGSRGRGTRASKAIRPRRARGGYRTCVQRRRAALKKSQLRTGRVDRRAIEARNVESLGSFVPYAGGRPGQRIAMGHLVPPRHRQRALIAILGVAAAAPLALLPATAHGDLLSTTTSISTDLSTDTSGLTTSVPTVTVPS